MITLQGITKIYRTGKVEVTALQGINLHIAKGEFVAIMGPSGSGKSTMMNILGCLDTPTAGEYILDGMKVAQASRKTLAAMRNKKLGFIFQGFNLLPRTTALENVELPLIYAGVKKKERRERAIEALKAVGLEERIRDKPQVISGDK